ncbi:MULTISPECIES: MFS transporter [Moraxella]|uniref:L-Proline/Glycine betaine transporter ProP n=2 Tax=Moraxella catarrhalis TaxID=480 RepID=A0A7Z0UWC2_MORCA|nr:MFS transporter [Moraxella catarrhalis]OAU98925.1 L-Proline/Glycine betaine transporter ProP [Moraxella catarrhalis]STY82469.1 Inner membrane metabolite transport protein yhjE [Moraxella catarrhalis]
MEQVENRKTSYKVLAASLIGSAIEWFDYFLYGTVAALIFNQLYFPTEDPTVGTMLAFMSFGLSFFIRPFGGIFFSHIGDKIGRKKTLVLTLTLMGGATVLMGLLPTYQAIGIAAPILMVLLRLIQGLGIGGEWGGAMLLAVEYAPKEKRGLFGAVPQMGVTLGMLLATLALTIMTMLPEEDFISWGWRVPFIGSALLVLLGLWIRKGIDETPAFKKNQEEGKVVAIPLIETLRTHKKEVLIAIGAKCVETGPFYIMFTFIMYYATQVLTFERSQVLNAVTIATLITTFLIPIAGSLSDKLGRKTVYIGGVVLMMIYAFPYFWMLNTGSVFWLNIATIVGLGIIWTPITAVLGTMFSEIFKSNVRYTGITLGYQIGAAIAGGTAPMVALWLLNTFDLSYTPIAIYIICMGLVSITAVWAAGEHAGKEMID